MLLKNCTTLRMSLYRKRTELKRVFEKIVSKLNKLGYLDRYRRKLYERSKSVAVFAEQKRMVKGILHGESDSRRTSFIEPEETTHLNNELSLENEERKEVYAFFKS